MRIAILSDTHDNIWKLDEAMPHLREADVVLHCGDLISPFVIRQMADGLQGIDLHVIWGNNDGDQRALTAAAQQSENIYLHGHYAALELGDLKIAMNHYPDIARSIALSGRFDLVCYGHDHTAHEEKLGRTLLLNPGEVMGLHGRCTFADYSTDKASVAWIELGAPA